MRLKPGTLRSFPSGAGLLVVLPFVVDGAQQIPPGTQLLGLPLLRRIVLAADRAGFQRILVKDARFDVRHLLAGTPASVLAVNEPIPPLLPGRVVSLPMNVLPKPEWLRQLHETPIEPEQLYADATSVAVIDTKNPGRVVAVAVRSPGAAETLSTLRTIFDTVESSFNEDGRFLVASSADVAGAQRWLLRGLIKPSEGFMSRHVERHLSLALTRRLAATRVRPNAVTLLSVFIGLMAAPFFLASAWTYQLAGALLLLAHSILDGCDGELARLKFMESRIGAILDFWGDNLVHVAVFACMAVGWSLGIRATWPLVFGAVTIVSTGGAACVVYRRTLVTRAGAGTVAGLSRLTDALAHRDFIYLIILLAAAGKAGWFLIPAAVGTPAFLLLVLWTNRSRLVS